MGILSGLFHSRDKPTNATSGSSYRFFLGGSTSGKAVTERSAMQMTAVYSCVRILADSCVCAAAAAIGAVPLFHWVLHALQQYPYLLLLNTYLYLFLQLL